MSVWTSTVMMKPPEVARDNASWNTTLVVMSASDPPCCAGYIKPSQPSAPILRRISRGVLPASSQASAKGSTSLAMKRATWRRSSSCSGREYTLLAMLWRSYMRNTPNVVSGIGAFSEALSARASVSRVSSGSMTPSSHSRAVA